MVGETGMAEGFLDRSIVVDEMCRLVCLFVCVCVCLCRRREDCWTLTEKREEEGRN